jgi:hypothetical protein
VLFGTTDPNLWGGPATGFDCYMSDDLIPWEGPIPAFRPPAGFWADTQFWLLSIKVNREGLIVESVSWWGSAAALDHQIALALDLADRLTSIR